MLLPNGQFLGRGCLYSLRNFLNFRNGVVWYISAQCCKVHYGVHVAGKWTGFPLAVLAHGIRRYFLPISSVSLSGSFAVRPFIHQYSYILHICSRRRASLQAPERFNALVFLNANNTLELIYDMPHPLLAPASVVSNWYAFKQCMPYSFRVVVGLHVDAWMVAYTVRLNSQYCISSWNVRRKCFLEEWIKLSDEMHRPIRISKLSRVSVAVLKTRLLFTARCSYASAVLGVIILSVCPSVRLSVRLSHACFLTNPKNLPAIIFYHMKGQSF